VIRDDAPPGVRTLTDHIASLRREYARQGLSEADLDADPVRQFQRWFEEALASNLPEPNAVILATATADGRPSARTVLLKGISGDGFVFHTNHSSRKAREIAENPRAALCFLWPELERQVRIEGRAEKISPEESDTYFATRPEGSRLGAVVSPQSEVIPNREFLERRWEEMRCEFEGREIPRPEFWGGYRVVPESIEFWQGRPNRLHDRLRYRRADDRWVIERLAP
jgi:pyridoxamine 5'-phosphate oxidase